MYANNIFSFNVKDRSIAQKKLNNKSEFTPQDSILFTYLIDQHDGSISELLDIIIKSNEYFDDFDVPMTILNRIEDHIDSLYNPAFWSMITGSPDYSYILHKNRAYPFDQVESKDWKKVNIDAYDRHVKKDIDSDDYADEKRLIKNNNYLAMCELPLQEYDLSNELSTFDKLTKINKRLAIRYVNILMSNPDKCHIIRYPNIIDYIKDEPNFDYFMAFAMYLLKHEETIIFSHINPQSRLIFKHQEVYNWPYLEHAYITQLSDESYLKSLPFYLVGQRRLTTPEEFQERFKLATHGLFEGFDLNKYSAAITGSILVPCAHVSPLETLFDTFKDYLEFYYPGYDSVDSIETFESDAEMLSENQSAPTVKFNLLSDIDISVTTCETAVLKEFVIDLHKHFKTKTDQHIYITEVRTLASIKYKLHGPGLPRPIDIFKIHYHPAKMVKKFHFNQVKMFYTNDLYMLRSCIVTLLTGVGEAYKWFSCNKVAVDVIMKYAQRGFTVILNKSEKEILKKFIKVSKRWQHLSDYEVFSCIGPNHAFYRDGSSGSRKDLKHMTSDRPIYNNVLSVIDTRIFKTEIFKPNIYL